MARNDILDKLSLLENYFKEGRIPRIHNHEANPGLEKSSRENYLYFTLPVSLNFQRSSPALRASAYKTWQDPETNYLFYPEKVIQFPIEKVRSDLKRHKLALQENKHTHIWYTLCQSFHTHFKDDPRNLIKDKNHSVTELTSYLVENNKKFPYLNGPKLSHYRLFTLYHYTDIKLTNREKLSIIPDTHIQQASIKLGVTTDQDKPDIVTKKWFDLLEGTNMCAVDFHSVLWNWSRNDFDPKV